jgi:hypothetical protein
MDQLRESSLLFSLEGLLETERERVQREAREAQKRHDEELKRVADAAERRRLAAQNEREARERRQLLEQERERLEQERLEAMKRATVERARIEAEGKMRLIELEQSRKHDLALAQIREAERTGRYRTWSWLSSAALLVVGIASGASYFGLLKPAHARETQQLQALLDVAKERASLHDRALTAERSKTRQLSERIRELEARPPASEPAAAPRPGNNNTRGPRVIVEPVRPPCDDNGDPLNPCLNGRRR